MILPNIAAIGQPRKSMLLNTSMPFSVCRSGAKKLKVFDSVIGLISIDVMHLLKRFKVAIQGFFHHQTVFRNALVTISKRVIWLINKNIPFRVLAFPAPPVWMVLSSKYLAFLKHDLNITFRNNLGRTLRRAILLRPVTMSFGLEFPTANWTLSFLTRGTILGSMSSDKRLPTLLTSHIPIATHTILL